MAGDFRKIERALADFFRIRGGVRATSFHGDIYLGVISTVDNGEAVEVVKETENDGPVTEVISLTELARELAEFE